MGGDATTGDAGVAAQAASSDTVVVGSALRLSLRVTSLTELDTIVTKEADERLSVPELCDVESPLPIGWVVVECSMQAVTCSIREHLLSAADRLTSVEVPEAIRSLPQVQEQARALRRLVSEAENAENELGGFTVCLWRL